MSSDTDALVDALTDGEYEYVPVDDLHPHPENAEVYGDIDPGESFVEDIRRNGVETPLIVNNHEDTEVEWGLPNTIIGGHRRLEAARRADLEAVPVRWKQYPEPMATRRLVQNNKQREKTPGQVAREALTLEETAREISEPRMGERTDLCLRGDKGNESKHWDKEVANDLGVGKDTVRRATNVYRFAYPDEHVHDDLQNVEKYDVPEEVREEARRQIELMDADEQGFKPAYEEVKKVKNKLEDEQRREEQRESFAEAVAESGAATVAHGDFVEVLSEYDDESIDHIVTDPPYNEDALPLWDELGRIAARVLKPGGFLAAYTGQYLLPDVLDRLRNHLTYYWQFVTLDDQPTFFIKKRIGIRYKPVVVFAKSPLKELDKQAHDVIDAGDRSKENHKWEQPTEKAAEIITALSEPDELICDPMCGSGTTGVAALNNHRRTLLIDRDEEAVKTTNRRISGVLADD